ncbi:MAG: UDP-N-acetylmuramoyl-L-alanine--D-glutamate ligase [Bifidobacterium sp.]|uniref:UDP-N-acetylmuramoyl-L-alanine--D-glutamate ligase n=1 Tax=Bifidobacterium TaxID=1678 RepID=UPI00164296C5|nr:MULTISPECIES: UDP-N-acetylmuramoyl-L-alanine--D-glutamate ligase [Bifidobacterium]MBS7035247.1 UDP-N-acetylmuramoyl-L-alanine--D-glutamate ligase [Bifidobacterium sp.]MDU2100148.1 UDP-N-acetylmuramoyl-L-alanine--D-glutamate ligase [Bifidobacterium sp.]
MDMDMSGKTVIVAGLGVSGQSMMEVLGSRAEKVLGVDEKKPDADLHSFDRIDWDHVDLVMTSPVFNPRTPFILEAQRRGIPVMSEVELAWQLRVNCDSTGEPARWIGITGTNGKTSTTEMTSEMLTACGLMAPAVGNIGKAVSHAAVDPANDVLCVELSSFQLHFTDSLALDCAAITNIADDHLDWHGGIENYAADKAKVFHRVKKALVYNADDERVTRLAFAAETAEGCRKVGFTLSEPQDGQIGVKDGWIVDMSGIAGGEPGMPEQVAKVSEFTHLTEPDGTVYPHLLADALTALALVLGLGADKEKAIASLEQFTPGGHRIQTVATATTPDGGSIRFVDDSKATNAHAAKASLNSFADKSVVWIAGGLAKGSRFEQLVAEQSHTIKAAVVIGKDQQPILDAFAASAPDIPLTIIDPANNDVIMERAVDAAGEYAQSGDVVLMAPACASMDQFKSYADRGNQFAQQAQRWVNEHGEA